MARTEVRKECPSCGLGVSLDAKVCEFCGWDFEEEDEWISQIEKLEQELITEKQRFDDTASDRMIQSTLHPPTLERPKEGGTKSVIIKKKAAAQGEFRVKVVAPMEERLAAEEARAKMRESAKPAVPASKPKSLRIDVSKIPPPPEEIDLRLKKEIDLELEEEEIAEPKPQAAKPAPVAFPAPAQPTRKVRRVVTRASRVKAIPTAAPPATGKPAAAKPLPGKAQAPVVPKAPSAATEAPPVALAKAAAAPPREEKKSLFGGFGKMFSVSVPVQQKKPETKPVPSKAPTKAPSAPAKAPAASAIPAQRAPTPPAKPPVTVKVFVCPLCNKEVKETESRCPNCGAEFE